MKSRIAIVGITLLSLIFWLVSFPAHWVDSWLGIFPLTLYFLSFAAGLFGWGLIVQRRLGGGPASVWLYSSLVAVAAAFVLGHLGLLGAGHKWIFLIVFHLGILLAPWSGAREAIVLLCNPWLNGVLIFVFGLRFLSAYLPQGHGDPLLYHLMGPRLWNQMGAVHLHPDLPIPLLAASWEYFYLWPQVLFTAEPASVHQLVAAQIFSQWIHLFWGLFGSLAVLNQLIGRKSWFSGEVERGALFLALIFVPSIQWTAALAKNDCAVAFWSLGAWLFLREALSTGARRWWFLGGLFAGLAVSAKISAILFLIPLAVVVVSQYVLARKPLARLAPALGLALGGSLLGAGPVYLRNWLETENPFYTMFAKWFPGPWVSQSWALHFNTHQPSGGASWLEMMVMRLGQLGRESPMLWLWLLLPLLLLRPGSRRALAEWRDWIAIFALSYVLMFVAVMHDAELRYLGASLWIAAVLAVCFGLLAIREFLPRWQKAGGIVIVLALLGISKLPTHLLWKFFRTEPGAAFVLTHTGGEAKAWLRENAGNRLVVIYGDNETYYLSTIRTTVLTERPDIDAATFRKTDVKEFMKGLCETSRAGLLIDVRTATGLHMRFPGVKWEEAVLFERGTARVYDLVKLQSMILGGDFGCGQI